MTAVSEGNGLNYCSYLGIGTATKKLDDPEPDVDILTCDDTKHNTDHEQVGVGEDSTPVLDITINNVVCSFNLRCHLNLKHIALNGCNVEYKRENGMVTMKMRNPSTTASIWSSGKITCTGATSDADAKKASRRFARAIQQLGFKVKFANFRIVNVLGTCSMPFAIKITQFSAQHRQHASYEPELHPGVTYKIKEIRATLKIFSTGSITITAPSIENVQKAVEHIYPLVYEFRKEKPPMIPSGQNAHISRLSKSISNFSKVQRKEESCDTLSDGDADMCDSDENWN